MPGERDLTRLLANLSPTLSPREYVFCTFPDAGYGDHPDLSPVGVFAEVEGLTLIVPRAEADARGCAYEGVFRCITLQVHSSLDAVGLTAAVAGVLAQHDIPANVVAAYHHDHLFVPAQRAEDALAALAGLTD
jgi:hypothetical protein